MESLRFFSHWVDRISDLVGRFAGYLLLLIIAATLYEIVMRYGFNRPTIWAYELGQSLFGAHFMLAGVLTLRHREHIGMDIFTRTLSIRNQSLVNCITFAFIAFFCGILIYTGGHFALLSISRLEHSNSVWAPPVYPLKAILPLSGLLLLLQATSNFMEDLYCVITGKKWPFKEVETT